MQGWPHPLEPHHSSKEDSAGEGAGTGYRCFPCFATLEEGVRRNLVFLKPEVHHMHGWYCRTEASDFSQVDPLVVEQQSESLLLQEEGEASVTVAGSQIRWWRRTVTVAAVAELAGMHYKRCSCQKPVVSFASMTSLGREDRKRSQPWAWKEELWVLEVLAL